MLLTNDLKGDTLGTSERTYLKYIDQGTAMRKPIYFILLTVIYVMIGTNVSAAELQDAESPDAVPGLKIGNI